MSTPPIDVVLLGATGSVGIQTQDVIARYPDRLRLVAAVAARDVAGLRRLEERFPGTAVAITAPPAGVAIPDSWRTGDEAAVELAAHPADVVLVAITGAAALRPALAAIDAGRRIALATKEVLVMAGALVNRRLKRAGARIVPVDSEHSALWQCLRGERPGDVARLVLTASGGPFRRRDPGSFDTITAAEALQHPTWTMGPKVTVDSATMMNKGLEIIEAHHLFGVDYDHIAVAVHPASSVHSMVEFVDGTTIAQIGRPDMRVPIALALTDGERLPGLVAPLDLTTTGPLEFLPVDEELFPATAVARDAGRRGGAAPAVLNAANEIAVEAFLGGALRYPQIVELVSAAVRAAPAHLSDGSIEELEAADRWARDWVAQQVAATP